MKLFEYEAKQLLESNGISVPDRRLVRHDSRDDFCRAVTAAAGEIGSSQQPIVIKSQVLMGGRGKAGLVRKVESLDEASLMANELFDGPFSVRTVLVEQAIDAAQELYVAITVDALESTALILASTEGGVEIEELASTSPNAILKVPVRMEWGLQPYQKRALAFDLGFSGKLARQFSDFVGALYRIFCDHDAELVEVNPVFVAPDGNLLAGDAKITIDDNSLGRQPQFALSRERYDSDAEYEAALEGIPYLQFDGDISLMCAGAGLTTAVFDLVHYEGGTVANYLEFGGPNYRKAKRAMELCLQNDSKVILVVTFGTIARADVMAEGVVEAIQDLRPDRPIVTCIRGTNEERAIRTLSDAGLDPLFDTEEAVRLAVRFAKAAGGRG